ncbi:MAG: glycosyltransferase family 2 protein, partial [Olsenella sp.]
MIQQTVPLVTVLVPIYNVEKYLGQCLESARTQTLENIEIICINDGSTDGSVDIIKSFINRDNRFRIIDKPNSGYGDSMNRGLEEARGKYVSILESDDFLDADALEYMSDLAEEQDLEVMKCNFWLYWSEASASHSYRHDCYFPLASPEMINLGAHAPIDYPNVFWAKASIWSAL